LVQKFFEGAL
jgi:hypothetical protein